MAAKATRAMAGTHLTALAGLSPEELRWWLSRARDMKAQGPRGDELAGRTVANLFFEDSTRTRTSFAIAARRLGGDVVDLTNMGSSVSKGETLIDTARTVEAMGVAAMVVRAKQSGAAEVVARSVRCPVINAGDGRHEHPTQGLLDGLTIAEATGREEDFDFAGLMVMIVGDVASSRVARSAAALVTGLGGRVVFAGPPGMAPGSLAALGVTVTADMDGALPKADVVMMLRVQFERHDEGGKSSPLFSAREFRARYSLTVERAGRMKQGAWVMHPGPMNRGIEIDGAVADGERSLVLRQVANGVHVRSAVLAELAGAR